MILSHDPFILFFDLVGRAGATASLQNGPTGSNAGITGSVIVISIVAVAAHSPGAGVKEYVILPAVAVLTVLSQEPETPFLDMAGSAGAGAPLHNGPMGSNTGIVFARIVTSIVALDAHWPAVGVNV